MKTSKCTCGNLLFFENSSCVNCKREVGFLPDTTLISSLEPAGDQLYTATGKKDQYKKCQNYCDSRVCNWMIPVNEEKEVFCVSCRTNLVIPDLTNPKNLLLWKLIEAAKRRFVYSGLTLKLPILNRIHDPKIGLGFKFMADTVEADGTIKRVLTGHDHGIITMNIEEADDAVREKTRMGMGEPYRTLLGHFRHETGHYYWDRLIAGAPLLKQFRNVFGDEQVDYDAALKAYYAKGPPLNWEEKYISAYATMHPWEDWAETWAHFLHVHDTLEVAVDFGFVGKRIKIVAEDSNFFFRPHSFNQVMDKWTELTVALNCINRSMGLRDFYPFVLSKPVIEKLHFISEMVAFAHKSEK